MEIVMKKPTVPGAEKPGGERPPVYRGKPGPQGPAGTIEIAQVVTIEPSDPARVENIGDSTNAKLILYIPKGDPGNRGEPGPAVEITEDIIQAIISELDLTPELVGLGNVDNTSDMDKPVSNPQSAAISAATTMVMSAINNHVANTNNPHGVTIEQIGAAPAGYGLGGQSSNVNADEATQTGFYQCWLNVTGYSGYASLEVNSTESGIITQKATTAYRGILHRVYYNGWSEWEWVNPPMTLGVEYRTTERWQGKSVYTTLVDCGIVPNAGIKSVGHGLSIERVLRKFGSLSYFGIAAPYMDTNQFSNANPYLDISANRTAIFVKCGTSTWETAGYTVLAQIYYTKP